MNVSFLIPVFSEVESLKKTISILEETCKGYIHEILLLMHRDSIPACKELCRRLTENRPHIKCHKQAQYPGQGYALREGFQIASGTHILMMCSDLETNPYDAIRLIKKMEEKSPDLVIASRWAKGSRFEGYGVFKVFLNFVFQHLFSFLFATKVNDFTYLYKIASTKLFKSIHWEGSGHELALETTLKPLAQGKRVEQISTTWVARSEGKSNQHLWKYLKHVKLGFKIYFQKLFLGQIT